MDTFIESCKKNKISIKQNEPLAPYTTFHIGGNAKYFAKINDIDNLIKILKEADKNNISTRILGKGSNVLINNKGFNGLIIINNCQQVVINGNRVTSNSGISLGGLIIKTIRVGLQGLEALAGVPGTLGGAIHHNAGTKNGEIKDCITAVDTYNAKTNVRKWLSVSECQFSYRKSFFSQNPEYIILQATFALSQGDTKHLKKKLQREIFQKVKNQDYEHYTAGCAFKNYVFKNEQERNKAVQNGLENGIKQNVLSIGWLFDSMDLKGFAIGDASISKKHANFIINSGQATAEQVAMLIGIIKQRVRDAYGIELHEEIEYIGF